MSYTNVNKSNTGTYVIEAKNFQTGEALYGFGIYGTSFYGATTEPTYTSTSKSSSGTYNSVTKN